MRDVLRMVFLVTLLSAATVFGQSKVEAVKKSVEEADVVSSPAIESVETNQVIKYVRATKPVVKLVDKSQIEKADNERQVSQKVTNNHPREVRKLAKLAQLKKQAAEKRQVNGIRSNKEVIVKD